MVASISFNGRGSHAVCHRRLFGISNNTRTSFSALYKNSRPSGLKFRSYIGTYIIVGGSEDRVNAKAKRSVNTR